MKKARKRIIMIFRIFAIIVAVFFGSLLFLVSLLWVTHYTVTVVDTDQSADGVYGVILLAVGEPEWRFGSAPGQLVLGKGERIVSKADFEIDARGESFGARSWSVTWYDDHVEIILSGRGQYDELVALYYDGQIERCRLTTQWGRHIDSHAAEDVTDLEDDPEYELFPDEQLINDGYQAIYRLFSDSPIDNFEVFYGAKESSSRCILSEDENTVEYMVYNGKSENEKCGLYVRYQSAKNADGTWSNADGTIVDIYAYVYESGDVVSSGKTHWGDIGSEAYREITGED